MADGLQYNPPVPTLEIDQSKPAPVYDQSQTSKTDVKDASGRYSYLPADATDVNGRHSRMEDGKPNHARILGMRRRNFWFLLVLAFVLVGATIGGSIGGVLAVQNKASNSNTATDGSTNPTTPMNSTNTTNTTSPPSTDTPYTAPPFSSLNLINVTCPSSSINSMVNTPLLRGLYKYDCLDNTNIGGVIDLASFTAYTLEQCVDACSQWNFREKKETCQAIVINNDIGYQRSDGNGANCWLKSNTDSFGGKGFTTAKLVVGADGRV